MKKSHLWLTCLWLAGCTTPTARQDDTESVAAPQDPPAAQAPDTSAAALPPGPADTIARSSGKVWHYTCPNGHPEGSDTEGVCGTCGAPLIHNPIYHEAEQGLNPSNAPMLQPGSPDDMPVSQDPPQNAQGVWHYTCPNGHAGGSGAADPCPVCGAVMQHNQAYHGQ